MCTIGFGHTFINTSNDNWDSITTVECNNLFHLLRLVTKLDRKFSEPVCHEASICGQTNTCDSNHFYLDSIRSVKIVFFTYFRFFTTYFSSLLQSVKVFSSKLATVPKSLAIQSVVCC